MESFTKYEHIQIDEVCRICLQKKDQMNLICEAGFADMLLDCASVQVTPENGLFNLVCRQCANEVSRWYVFKQQILRSFEIGKWLLERKAKLLDDHHVQNVIVNSKSLPVVQEHSQNIKLIVTTSQSQLNTEYFVQQSNIKMPINQYNNNNNNINVKRCKLKKSPDDLICKICSKQCKSSNSYNRHIRTHDDSRPYVCSKCDKPFKTSQVLTEHMKRHYDDRRYKCNLCGMKYYAKASLNDHIRSHTGERPFKCDSCGKAFATRAILRQHMAVHTVREKKYQCDVCNKFLLTVGSLETHKRKHADVKPFPCTTCDRAFSSKETLQRHRDAVHDTDDNFLRDACNKVCTTKSSFSK